MKTMKMKSSITPNPLETQHSESNNIWNTVYKAGGIKYELAKCGKELKEISERVRMETKSNTIAMSYFPNVLELLKKITHNYKDEESLEILMIVAEHIIKDINNEIKNIE